MRGIAGKQVAGGLTLVDTGDLLREECSAAALIIDPRRTQDHGWDRASLGPDHLLRFDLRLRVGPFGVDRPVFGDRPSRLRRGMDEQGAREYKLLDCVEALAKAAQEPARSLDLTTWYLGSGLPGEVVIRREVNN